MDQAQQQSQSQSQSSSQTSPSAQGGPARAKKSVVSKMAAAVAAHSYLSLAMIVVLVVIIIGTYVYYRGVLFLGPYAKAARPGAKAPKGAKPRDDSGGASAEPAEKGDSETERLIDSINSH